MSKEKLLKSVFKSEEIEIDGDKYLVKELSAKDGTAYENSLYKIVGDKVVPQTDHVMTRLVLMTLCDLEGTRVFDDKDLNLVGELPASVINQIFEVSARLNGLDKKSEKN